MRAPGLVSIAALGVFLFGAAPAAADVLMVGDSLSIGTAPYLERELGSIPLELDAVVGRPSPNGLEPLSEKLRPEHDVVVYDLGVNDGPSQPGELEASLATASYLAGDRCLVVGTVSRPPLNGVSVEAQNQVVRDFAAATGSVLVDWRAAAQSEPGLLRADGVHATPTGYALRGLLFAEAIADCLAGIGDIPAPRADAEPPPAPEPEEPKPPPRRPARIDWSVPAGWWPVRTATATFANAIAAVRRRAESLRDAFAGAPPEPVLGAPES